MPASRPQCEPGRGPGRGASPLAPVGAACELADTAPGAPRGPAPACETRRGPGNLLPVVSGRVLVADAVASGEVAVGAAGPHGPGAQGQLAGLQPCRQAGVPLSQARCGRMHHPFPRACALPTLRPVSRSGRGGSALLWAGLGVAAAEKDARWQGRQSRENPRLTDRGSGQSRTSVPQRTPGLRLAGVLNAGPSDKDA